MPKKFLLCFHDLSVQNYETVLPVLFKLQKIAGAFSVLVIPCVDGRSEVQIEGFKGALQTLSARGFELALHGFWHCMDSRFERSCFGKFANRIANSEAEFAGLKEYDSAALLDSALAAWKRLLGLQRPAAFVAPTWHGNPYLKKQVLERGMVFENRSSIVTSSKKYVSPVTSFAGIPAWLEGAAVGAGYAFLKMPAHVLGMSQIVPRIALHPVDFPHLEKKVFKLVECAAKNLELIGYGDL